MSVGLSSCLHMSTGLSSRLKNNEIQGLLHFIITLCIVLILSFSSLFCARFNETKYGRPENEITASVRHELDLKLQLKLKLNSQNIQSFSC